MERWLPVVDYEGLYEVSDMGHVRSLDRRIRTHFGTRHTAGRMLKAAPKAHGYLEVQLQDSAGGRPIRYALVHRLVLEAFVGPCPEGMECRHRDDNDRTNCRLTNLEWGTRRDNMADQTRHGTRIAGERHPNMKITDDMVREIRTSKKSGAQLAREYGVNVTAVCKARRGETHSATLV